MTAAAPDTTIRPRVISVATSLFAARGFDGTSLQDIAERVGASKPAVLHHFSSKEEIRKAVLAGILAHWKERVPSLLLAATAEDRFDRLVGELFEFFAADPDRARLVMREVLDRPEEMKAVLRSHVRPWLAAIVSYIERGKENGEHHTGVDPDAYVLHVLMMMVGAIASRSVLTVGIVPEVGSADSAGGKRYDRELLRIARQSLFAGSSPPPSVPPVSSRPPRSKKPASRK